MLTGPPPKFHGTWDILPDRPREFLHHNARISLR